MEKQKNKRDEETNVKAKENSDVKWPQSQDRLSIYALGGAFVSL